jgi:glycosyltransferase involved in cell wall biosynthesis
MWPNKYARCAANMAGKPLVISTRGMLEGWSLGRAVVRKFVAWQLFERKNLESAALFHATSESEAEAIATALRIKMKIKIKEPRIVVAPNGVDVPERIPGREVVERKFPRLKGKEWVLFMSRIHPKKGIDLLLEAWKEQMTALGQVKGGRREEGQGLQATGYRNDPFSISQTPSVARTTVLVIAGADLIGYGAEVERMIREKGLGETVLMTGHVDGEVREALLGHSMFLVLPSHSENFGLVVAESLARGRPVITTTGTPWKELKEWGAGWWVEPKKESITQAMGEALTKTDAELDQMGARGRKMVGERFSWKAAAETILEAYKGIAGQ